MNEAGNVIGIVTWNWRGQNLNFAVAASHLLDLRRYQASAIEEKAGERDTKRQPMKMVEQPESGTVSFDYDSDQSSAAKVVTSSLEIVGRETGSGVRITIANYEQCLVNRYWPQYSVY